MSRSYVSVVELELEFWHRVTAGCEFGIGREAWSGEC